MHVSIYAFALKARAHVAFDAHAFRAGRLGQVGGTRDGIPIATFGIVAGVVGVPTRRTANRRTVLSGIAALVMKLRTRLTA